MHKVASNKNSQRDCAKCARLNEPDKRDIGFAGRYPEPPSDRMISSVDSLWCDHFSVYGTSIILLTDPIFVCTPSRTTARIR